MTNRSNTLPDNVVQGFADFVGSLHAAKIHFESRNFAKAAESMNNASNQLGSLSFDTAVDLDRYFPVRAKSDSDQPITGVLAMQKLLEDGAEKIKDLTEPTHDAATMYSYLDSWIKMLSK